LTSRRPTARSRRWPAPRATTPRVGFPEECPAAPRRPPVWTSDETLTRVRVRPDARFLAVRVAVHVTREFHGRTKRARHRRSPGNGRRLHARRHRGTGDDRYECGAGTVPPRRVLVLGRGGGRVRAESP